MYHYLYKITSASGKYYIGRHSTKNLDDKYMGSGKWVRSLKNKKDLNKEILEFYDTIDDLLHAETILIEKHIKNENNMNFNYSPVGFSTGNLNPNTSEESRKRLSEAFKGDKNPSKRVEVSEKISKSLKKFYEKNNGTFYGKKHTEESKEKMSKKKIGAHPTEETREKLREISRARMLEGKNPNFTAKGRKHTEESKEKMKEAQSKRPRKKCEHCGIIAAINMYTRWHGDKCKRKR